MKRKDRRRSQKNIIDNVEQNLRKGRGGKERIKVSGDFLSAGGEYGMTGGIKKKDSRNYIQDITYTIRYKTG